MVFRQLCGYLLTSDSPTRDRGRARVYRECHGLHLECHGLLLTRRLADARNLDGAASAGPPGRISKPMSLTGIGAIGSALHLPGNAASIAAPKLPKRRRIVFSLGDMPAAVQDSAVGRLPNCWMKPATAASAKSSPIRPSHSGAWRSRPRNAGVFVLCMSGSTPVLSLALRISAGTRLVQPHLGIERRCLKLEV